MKQEKRQFLQHRRAQSGKLQPIRVCARQSDCVHRSNRRFPGKFHSNRCASLVGAYPLSLPEMLAAIGRWFTRAPPQGQIDTVLFAGGSGEPDAAERRLPACGVADA